MKGDPDGRFHIWCDPRAAAAYHAQGHPEAPERVVKTHERLFELFPPDVFKKPAPIGREALERVHAPAVIERLEKGLPWDADTPTPPGSHPAALLSCGAALGAARDALEGVFSFSLMRPPGHHATPVRGMGFCYFNNVAVALEELRSSGKITRAAILDLDCHHGNGTQDFVHGREENYLYLSLHQYPCYPGTGLESGVNFINFPLPPKTRLETYQKALEQAVRRVLDFHPQILAVSMGFDTYEKDPLTQFGLRREDYRVLGRWIKNLNLPAFAVLEGGYHADLPVLVELFLEGWWA